MTILIMFAKITQLYRIKYEILKICTLFPSKKVVNETRIFYFHYILYCEYKKMKYDMIW